MLAWQGATRTKARRGAGPRGGASSLGARWATTKRKLEATEDASDPSPRKRVAVTLKPPSTSLDILDLAVLRRLSDEHGLAHPDDDASSLSSCPCLTSLIDFQPPCAIDMCSSRASARVEWPPCTWRAI